MPSIKKTFKIGLLTLFSLLLVIHGQSMSVTNIRIYDSNSTWMLTLSASNDPSSGVKHAKATKDDDKSSDTSHAKNCKNVNPLEKVSGPPRFLRNIIGARKLRPKDIVPEFTLPRIDGEEVALYDVLAENDYVLIDFWATACGPCIAQFPKLKKIYEEYSEEKFEIVSICTDLTHEQWEESSEEHKLPWVDLAEINDEYLGGPTSKAFRLRGLPRSYLVDTNGCILHTHIFPTELKKFLESKFDEEKETQEKSESQEISETEAH